MDKDNHLIVAHSLHHLLVKDFINHEHLPHSFFLSHSNIALLERYGTVALVEVEQSFLSGSQNCTYVLVVRESGREPNKSGLNL